MDEDNDRYLVHYHQPGWSYDCVATLPSLESAQRFRAGLTEDGIPSRLEILPFILVNKLIGDGNWHALVQEWEPERYSILFTCFPTHARISLTGLTDFLFVLQMVECLTYPETNAPSVIAQEERMR